MAAQRVIVTVDQFEEFLALPENRDRNFELIDGEIIEKMPTDEHGTIANLIGGEFYIYLKANPIGRAGVEVRFQMPDDLANSIQPDVSFIKAEYAVVKQGAVPRMPDLAVEIKSPSDTYSLLRDKAQYYLKNGTKLVWLVYPEQRIVEVYAPGVDLKLLTERDTLDGGEVLPNFTLAVSDIFKTL